jgi:Dolichyl-phosphate-mannose-protein mannosyltransferase
MPAARPGGQCRAPRVRSCPMSTKLARRDAPAGAMAPCRLRANGTDYWIWAALGIATAVAFGIRAALVGDQSLGYEEVFTHAIVGHGTAEGVWAGVRATESTPPLYYLLTWLWVSVTGDQSAVALRMTSVIAGTITVPAAFFAARYFVSDRVALATAWLCVISPVLIEYSLYARSYALFVLLVTISVGTVGALLRRPSVPRWILWALVAATCLWTHYFASFVIVGEMGVLFLARPRERMRLVLCSVGIVASFVPLFSLFQTQRNASGRTAFITARPLTSRVTDIVRQFAMGTNVPNAWLEASGIILLACGVVVGAVFARRPDSTRPLLAMALVTAGLPIAAALSGVADFLLPRNIIGALVCVAPLAASGLTRLRGFPLAAYSVICLVTAVAVQTNWHYQGSTDWQGASERLQSRARGEPIAVIPAMEVSVAALYLRRAELPHATQTRDLWVMAEPVRGTHQRALAQLASVPLSTYWGSGFRVVTELDFKGFRLIHLRSPRPVAVSPTPPASGSPGPPAVVLAP